MKNNNAFWNFLLFFIIVLPNIICYILKIYFAIDRPLIVYDYFFIIPLIAFRAPTLLIWGTYLALILIDLALITSKVYFFKLDNFFEILKYTKYYNFTTNQFLFFIFILFLMLVFLFIFWKINKMKLIKLRILYLYISLLVLFIFIDAANGSSDYMNIPFFKKKYIVSNFGSLNSRTFYSSLLNISTKHDKPIVNQKLLSVTFDYFSNDSASTQMLIIVESFGLIQDSIKRAQFQSSISNIFTQNKWRTSWGISSFNGSTTNSELKELLNCSGDYRFFNLIENRKKINSIFDIKKQQGYQVKGIHGFKGGMFERNIWWKNIGIDSAFFLEDFINNYSTLNKENPFTSLSDNEAFDAIQNKVEINKKQFIYFLTVNSHLPFLGTPQSPEISKSFNINREIYISDEAKNQNKRISILLEHIAKKLDYRKIDKILIIGDHAPPFIHKADKVFYSNKFVPYLFVYK